MSAVLPLAEVQALVKAYSSAGWCEAIVLSGNDSASFKQLG